MGEPTCDCPDEVYGHKGRFVADEFVPCRCEPEPATDLMEYLKAHPCKGFTPHAAFVPVLGWMNVYFEDAPCYADPVNDRLEVFRAFDDGRVVGVRVFGVEGVIERARVAHGVTA